MERYEGYEYLVIEEVKLWRDYLHRSIYLMQKKHSPGTEYKLADKIGRECPLNKE